MEEKITRADLIVLVRRIVEVDYTSEEEGDLLIAQLECHPRSSKIFEYIFGLDFGLDCPMTPEEVVDHALTYQPIVATYSPD